MITPTRTLVSRALQSKGEGQEITVKGWVRSKRTGKEVSFIALNDGSTIHNIQVVVTDEGLVSSVSTGACICVRGALVASQGGEQAVEVQARQIEVYGEAVDYPLQKKGHSLEFLREIAYLRPRTNTFGAVLRIRHAMAYAIHKYFNDNGFYYLHTPIITASDAEGAGAMFQVTTLDVAAPPRGESGAVDYSSDFFGKHTSLTVSGQLEGELGALAYLHFRADFSGGEQQHAEALGGVLDDRARGGVLWFAGGYGFGGGLFEVPHSICARQLCRRSGVPGEDVRWRADRSFAGRGERRFREAGLHRGDRHFEEQRSEVRVSGRLGQRPPERARTLSGGKTLQEACDSCQLSGRHQSVLYETERRRADGAGDGRALSAHRRDNRRLGEGREPGEVVGQGRRVGDEPR